MRTTAIAMLVACLPLAAPADTGKADRVLRLSEPVAVTATHEIFGAPMDVDGQPLSLKEAIGRSAGEGATEVLIAARVAQVCQKKGCFFIAEDGNTVARVTFKDYGFFIPTDSSGKTVLLTGVVRPSEVSAVEAEHYASDLGNTSPKAIAGIEHQIVASAVAVPRP
jgi:hypothetical protein